MKNPHDCYQEFVHQVRSHLSVQRGRAGALARYLGVTRQKISLWFGTGSQDCPGWVAIATQQWLKEHSITESNNRKLESLGVFTKAVRSNFEVAR
jgi:hypothetical protein